eukprot:6955422-Lingulodinium_polyedra.AAC.1
MSETDGEDLIDQYDQLDNNNQFQTLDQYDSETERTRDLPKKSERKFPPVAVAALTFPSAEPRHA